MFQKAQERKPAAERQTWNGSGSQVMSWHYGQSLGRYFNNPAEIVPMVRTMSLVAQVVFWGIPLAMLLLLWGARKNSRAVVLVADFGATGIAAVFHHRVFRLAVVVRA